MNSFEVCILLAHVGANSACHQELEFVEATLPFAQGTVAIQFRGHAQLPNMKTKAVDSSKRGLGIVAGPEHQADFHRFYLSQHRISLNCITKAKQNFIGNSSVFE
jgi:hypothetical protein